MRDINNKKLKIGDCVRCEGRYTFDPSEGIIIDISELSYRYHVTVKLYKVLNTKDVPKLRDVKEMWIYNLSEGDKVEKISKENYLLFKLKE